jgi:hypothetical protein
MIRRLSWIAVLVTALVLALAAPASAVGAFGSPQVLLPSCGTGLGDAAIAVDGTVRGFAECNGNPYGPIWYFRHTPGQLPFRQATPYTGLVLGAAWDGSGFTYVLFEQNDQLKIARRTESTGAYSAVTTLSTTGASVLFYTADVVASAGKWWAVWSEQVGPGGEFAQTELFQARTLLGLQGRTRITATASNLDDSEPSLAYAGGRVTLVWTRTANPAVPGPSDLRIATNTGGGWSSRLLAWAGDQNVEPHVVVYAGVTYVTWVRDGRIVVASNASGSFASHTFLTPGFIPTVAVSFGKVFVAWAVGEADPLNRVFLAERSGATWTGVFVTGAPAAPLIVLAQGGKARVVYRTDTEVRIRAQI